MKYRIIVHNLQTKDITDYDDKTYPRKKAQSLIDELNSKPSNDTIYKIEPIYDEDETR